LYDPFNPAHWQVWAGVGGSSGGRFGGYNNNGGGGYNNAPQAIPSNIDEAARSAAVNLAHRMGLRDIPDDGGRAQGGNLWRYTAMVEKGLIKPPSEGGKGWKSADELRTVTCYVSSREKGCHMDRRALTSVRAELSDLLSTAMWGEGSLRDSLSEPGKPPISVIPDSARSPLFTIRLCVCNCQSYSGQTWRSRGLEPETKVARRRSTALSLVRTR
jgi:hypothetical protein